MLRTISPMPAAHPIQHGGCDAVVFRSDPPVLCGTQDWSCSKNFFRCSPKSSTRMCVARATTSKWILLRLLSRAAGRATHLDGCEDRRLGGHAARRQARGNQRALDQRAAHNGGICERWCGPRGLRKARRKSPRKFRKIWNAERDCCFDVIDVPRAETMPRFAPIKFSPSRFPSAPSPKASKKRLWIRWPSSCSLHTGCEALRPLSQPTKANTQAGRAGAILPITREQYGAGCSVHLLWRIIVCTRIAPLPRVSSSPSAKPFTPTAWARLAKFSGAIRHFRPPAASRKPGASANSSAPGNPSAPLQSRSCILGFMFL